MSNTLLRSLYESENCVTDNIDLNYTINNYRNIMENLEVSGNPFTFDERMVPIIKDSLDGTKFSYLVPLEDIIRLSGNDITTMVETVERVMKINNEACGEEQCMTKDNTKIVIDFDDADDLEEACKKDPTKMKEKVNKVKEFTELIEALIDAGYTVVKNQR